MNTVKHLLLTAVAVAWAGTAAWAQTPAKVKYRFIEAADLGVLGHISQTQNPYHRVDTTVYKGWTAWQNNQVRCSSGLSVAFRTNSTVLTVKTRYGFLYTGTTTNVVAHKGYDLYIKKDGKWLYAESAVEDAGKPGSNVVIIKNMSNEMKECLLYLPLYSEEYSIQLGVEEGAVIEPIPAPFRHRIGIYGSSYTHGVSCGRAGMTYPAQFTRATGIQLLSLGMSGQCKMQPYAIPVLENAEVDGFIFDTFSNPSKKEICERLFPFIERLQAAHPGKPLIFQRTIYREQRNFDQKAEYDEASRIALTDSLMAIACKKYKDVYYIYPNATPKDHEAQIDATHPGNYGYQLWAESIEKPVLKILRKYGIR